MTIAEDMSYNHGPDDLASGPSTSSSRRTTAQLVPRLQETADPADRGHRRRRDAAGAVARAELGVDGVLPLERQAGVDGMQLRAAVPRACG